MVLGSINGVNGATASTNVGIGTTNPLTTLDVNGDLATRMGTITVTNGNQNNINIGGSTFVKITSATGNFNVTGLAGGVDGKMVILYNSTNSNMTFNNNNANSSAGNRILTNTGGNVATSGTGSAILVYDSAAAAWILVSVQA